MATIKNTKKNAVTVEWPTSYFTIDDVQSKYPGIVNITLRFQVRKAVDNKELVTIGKVKTTIGRPKLVFAKANPSKELLAAAKSAGVLFFGDKTSVPVAELTADKKTTRQATATVPAVTT